MANSTATPVLSPTGSRPQARADEPLPFRQAPHNLEAEQALLGAILVNNEAMDRVSSFLEPSISTIRCTSRSSRSRAS